ncbi:hypothetical protein IKE79_01415 [Candidatus Saccharibacteria bacterium]|nr:hypothetical protein [Candidatus Saccharibacteria bacterium]
MPKVIHAKLTSTKGVLHFIRGRVARSRLKDQISMKFSAIMCVLITLLTPVISVVANYSSVFADTQSMTFSVVVDETPFLSLTLGQNVTLEMSPGATTSSFSQKDFTASVTTTNATGYNLQMKTTSSSLVSGTHEIPSVQLDATNYPNGKPCTTSTANDGTACPFDDNSWGYKLSSNTGFLPVPTGEPYATVGGSTGPADDNNTVTFAAKVDRTVASGNYQTTINFIATAKLNYSCTNNAICYSFNAPNETSPTTMANQTTDDSNDTIANGSSVTLWASNFQRPNYGFLGWNTASDGSGTMYGSNETITVDNTMAAYGLQLYAIWLRKSDQYTMQTFTDATCKANLVTTNIANDHEYIKRSVIALEDERDGNVYAVARLADGNCWMIENLRLADTHKNNNNETVATELTPHNTNNPSLPITNSINQSTGEIESSSNHLSTTSDSWCNSKNSRCIDQSKINTNNTRNDSTGTISEMTGINQNVYGYGNYYNWYSATAGNGAYNNAINNDSVVSDACPKNWRLPQGGGIPNASSSEWGDNSQHSDFYILNKYITNNSSLSSTDRNMSYYANKSNLLRSHPNNFILSGFLRNSTIFNRGYTGGHYWSSTSNSEANSYLLTFNVNDINPGADSNYKSLGLTIRCLASN